MPRKSKKKELKKIDSRKKVSRKTAARRPAVAKASSGRKTGAVTQNDQVSRHVADAVLGIDTLWGGDVMCPSGTGRFIADCWFSDERLPVAYTHPAAGRLRACGGVAGKNIDRDAVEQYLREVNLPKAIAGIREEAGRSGALRKPYLISRADCLDVMWDLAMEVLGKGKPVPYPRCVEAATGKPPEPSKPEKKRARVAELLGRAGYASSDSNELLKAVDGWRRERVAPLASVRALSAAVIAQLDLLCAKNLLPYLPNELAPVPRANIDFLPIKDAWFSGSMNYIGTARPSMKPPTRSMPRCRFRFPSLNILSVTRLCPAT